MPSVTQFVARAPDEVFDLITSPTQLPRWNRVMERTVYAPERLRTGEQWVIEMHALGRRWLSRSTVLEIDRAERRFVHRSQTDDGNPSYAEWSWRVIGAPGGCNVTVSYALHPSTFWRRVLLVRIRSRQLARREVPDSLRSLALYAEPAPNP